MNLSHTFDENLNFTSNREQKVVDGAANFTSKSDRQREKDPTQQERNDSHRDPPPLKINKSEPFTKQTPKIY